MTTSLPEFAAGSETPAAAAPADTPAATGAPSSEHDTHHEGKLMPLAVGAIGVVFGDIGTSPLYSLRESFIGHHRLRWTPTTSSACSR